MKLLLFGGTFDPPHGGHMSLLQNAIEKVRPDQVVVVPAGMPPHKKKSATPPKQRLAMCECFRPLFPGLMLSDAELVRSGRSFTIDTVAEIHKEWPGAEVYLCIGGDMLLSFTAWRRWRELLAQVTIVAQSRGENPLELLQAAAETLRLNGGSVMLMQAPPMRMSSSEIRAAIAAGQDAAGLIPPPADEIIKRYGLYECVQQ